MTNAIFERTSNGRHECLLIILSLALTFWSSLIDNDYLFAHHLSDKSSRGEESLGTIATPQFHSQWQSPNSPFWLRFASAQDLEYYVLSCEHKPGSEAVSLCAASTYNGGGWRIVAPVTSAMQTEITTLMKSENCGTTIFTWVGAQVDSDGKARWKYGTSIGTEVSPTYRLLDNPMVVGAFIFYNFNSGYEGFTQDLGATYGIICERAVNTCQASDCEAGGFASLGTSPPNCCVCKSGAAGPRCQCRLVSQGGTCPDASAIGGTWGGSACGCNCKAGYSGPTCADKACVLSDCVVASQTVTATGYSNSAAGCSCVCAAGYGPGGLVKTNIDGCALKYCTTSDCENASRTQSVSGWSNDGGGCQCTCAAGFGPGGNTNVNTTGCAQRYCTVSADCTSNANAWRVSGFEGSCACGCNEQFTGSRCQTRICHVNHDCNGVGLSVSGTFPDCRCKCPKYYGGRNCRLLTRTAELTNSCSLLISPTQSHFATRTSDVTISISVSSTVAVSLTVTRSTSLSLSTTRSTSLSHSTTPSGSLSLSTTRSTSLSHSTTRSASFSLSTTRSRSVSHSTTPSSSLTLASTGSASFSHSSTSSRSLSLSTTRSRSASHSTTWSRSASLSTTGSSSVSDPTPTIVGSHSATRVATLSTSHSVSGTTSPSILSRTETGPTRRETFSLSLPETRSVSMTRTAELIEVVQKSLIPVGMATEAVMASVGTVATAIGGATAAVDAQAIAMLSLVSCGTRGKGDDAGTSVSDAEEPMRSLTIFALDNTCEGVLAGNSIAVGAAALLSLVGVLGLSVKMRSSGGGVWHIAVLAAMSLIQTPHLLITLLTYVMNSFLLCGVRLARGERGKAAGDGSSLALIVQGYAAAALPCLVVVSCPVITVLFGTRRLVPMAYEWSSFPLRAAAAVTLPSFVLDPKHASHKAFGAVFGAFRRLGCGWTLLAHCSFVAMMPATLANGGDTRNNQCGVFFTMSAVLFGLFSLLVLLSRPRRVLLSDVLQSLMLALNGVVLGLAAALVHGHTRRPEGARKAEGAEAIGAGIAAAGSCITAVTVVRVLHQGVMMMVSLLAEKGKIGGVRQLSDPAPNAINAVAAAGSGGGDYRRRARSTLHDDGEYDDENEEELLELAVLDGAPPFFAAENEMEGVAAGGHYKAPLYGITHGDICSYRYEGLLWPTGEKATMLSVASSSSSLPFSAVLDILTAHPAMEMAASGPKRPLAAHTLFEPALEDLDGSINVALRSLDGGDDGGDDDNLLGLSSAESVALEGEASVVHEIVTSLRAFQAASGVFDADDRGADPLLIEAFHSWWQGEFGEDGRPHTDHN